MRKKITIKFKKRFLLLLLLSMTFFASAQTFEYVAEKFTKDHGLPDQYIKYLDLDSDGNVWLLTRKGMVKFDGNSFEKIEINSKIPVIGFEIDRHDNLWLNLALPETSNLEDDRILIYNTFSKKLLTIKQYSGFDEYDNSRLKYLWKDSDNNIFFSYLRGAVFFYNGMDATKVLEEKSNILLNRLNRNPGSLSYVKTDWSELYFKDLKANSSRKYVDDNVYFYIWQDDEIKFKCHFENFWEEPVKSVKRREITLVSSSKDTIFQGARNSLYYDFDRSDFIYVFNRVLSVYNLDNRTNTNLSDLLFSSYDYMDILDIDARDNVIWVASTNGLIRIEKKKKIFQPIIHNNNLSIREMIARSDDSLLVNTEYGFYIINHKTNEVLNLIDPERYYYGLTDIGNGKFLVGNHGRLNRIVDIHAGNSEYVEFPMMNNGSLVHDDASHLNTYLDKNQTLWIASSSGICTTQLDNRELEYVFVDETKGYSFTDIVEGKEENTLFFLSHSGMFEVDFDALSVKQFSNFNDKVISGISQDKDDESIYWVGTKYGGLIKWTYDGEIIEVIDESDGLSNNNVHAIFEDKYGRLWLSTDYGISIYNKNSKEISIITEENGLHENEMNRHSYCFVGDSLIFFGGVNGITKFNPYDVLLDDFNGEIVLKSLNYIDRRSGRSAMKPIEDNMKELVIKRNQTESKLHFDIPENSFSNTLRFMFSSDNNEWSYTQGNVIDLSGVREGNSNLFVSKKIGIAEWSSPATISLYKAPPFYKAYWFYGLLISVLSFGAFLFVNNRRVQALKINRRINREVDIKTKELFHKNKSLTESKRLNEQLFSIIGHDLRSPLISLNNISKSINYLTSRGEYDEVKMLTNTIESNSKKTLVIIDRLIDWTEKQKKSMLEFHKVNILECIQKSVYEHQELADKKSVEILTEGREWLNCISNEASLLVVLGNLISNAVKFSEANGKIYIRFYKDGNEIVIEVEDHGMGMNEEQLHNLNNDLALDPEEGSSGELGMGMGISLSREIIKKINGCLSFSSILHKGTIASIRLPI